MTDRRGVVLHGTPFTVPSFMAQNPLLRMAPPKDGIGPPPRTDKHLWKHYLGVTSSVRANGTFFGDYHQTSARGGAGGGAAYWTFLNRAPVWPPDVTSRGFPCSFERGEPRVGGGAVYNEVQCIMGNGHIAHRIPLPGGQIDWQTETNENLAFPQPRWRMVNISVWNAWIVPRSRTLRNYTS